LGGGLLIRDRCLWGDDPSRGAWLYRWRGSDFDFLHDRLALRGLYRDRRPYRCRITHRKTLKESALGLFELVTVYT